MVVEGKIVSVGRHVEGGEFVNPDGRKFIYPARRSLIIQQDCGDICNVKVAASAKDVFERGKNLSVRVQRARDLGGIMQIVGEVA